MLGLLVNTVPVRVPIAAGATVLEWLRSLAEGNKALRAHEHSALSDIARWSSLSQGSAPFDHTFNYTPEFFEQTFRGLGGAWDRRSVLVLQRTGYPLAMSVSGIAPLTLRMEYDPESFEAAAVDELLRRFRALLLAMAAGPDTPLSRLPWIGAAERESLLAAGRASRAFPVCEPIHVRFERRVSARPEAPAVTFGGLTLSYGELEARANRLAHRLIALGVRRETPVGIALERSGELIVTLLAVLKAGGAYVPLDPSYPVERIAFVLADAAIPVLVTTGDLLPRLPGFHGATLRLDAEAAAIAQEPSHRPEVAVGTDDLAYVIYTSGSTGKPKGVQVTHANVVRLFDATKEWFGFGAEDVWTLFHSYAFDFSVWEIWGALLYGGRLVVVPFLTTPSPEDFHRLLVSEEVTVLNQTPSAFKQLSQADRASGIDPSELRLRYVVFGGEALDPQSLRPWMERYGDDRPRLINMYGITETTVHVTYRAIAWADLDRPGSPIGEPIPDLAFHVLDANLEPVPVGAPGEIFVGGAGVARGYLGRPELTAERFVRDPFSSEPGARLYRSGDLARRRWDGEVEYLGRSDRQVKIRGFRIETGEIEAALSSHPMVGSGAVVVREDVPGDKRLVAYYVVLVPGLVEPAPSELRAHLAERLPEHMVLAAFVALETLPLTENGKLDHRALPAPESVAGAVAASSYVAPQSGAEAALAGIWAEVLGLERVGVLDSFFALGGDSLRAVQLAAVSHDRGMHLTVQDLYQQPTIRGLAERFAPGTSRAEGTDGGVPHHLVDLPEEDWARVRDLFGDAMEDAYPATRMQMAMIAAYEGDTARDGIYHPQQLHRLTDASLSVPALRSAIERVVQRHPIFRTAFAIGRDGALLQVVREKACASVICLDLRELPTDGQERAVRDWKARDLDTPFDPYDPAGSLVRFAIFQRREDVADLLISAHHAIEDGWGNIHFLNTMFEAYADIRDGREVSAAAAPNAFREHVALEAEILASQEAQGFWGDRLERMAPPGRLAGTTSLRRSAKAGSALRSPRP